jgi:hypothetical protein
MYYTDDSILPENMVPLIITREVRACELSLI